MESEYILTKRFGSQTLNELNVMSEPGETQEEVRELVLCGRGGPLIVSS